MQSGDAILLARWREARDAQAFAELAARYAGLVYAVCRRVLGNEAEAEDVAQECFMSLAQNAPRKRDALGPWLYVVATHQALNRRKSQVRRLDREQRYAAEAASAHEAEWDDIQQYVDEAIAELPDKLRQPIVLHFLEGRSHTAVAESLGLPRTTVTARLARGIEETREQLKRRGVTVGAAALGAMLAAESATAAPAGLTAALGKMALAGAQGGAIGAAVGGLALKLGVAGGVLLIVAAVVSVIGFQRAGPAGKLTAADTPVVAAPDAGEAQEAQNLAGSMPAADSHGVTASELAVSADADALTGIVVDEAGAPVAGAEVVVGYGNNNNKTAGVQTDKSGQFRFEGLPPGPFVLHAFKSAVGLVSLEKVGSRGNVGDLTLEPLGSVSGRAYDKASGKPIASLLLQLRQYAVDDSLLDNARVMLETFQGGRWETQTDDSGGYQFVDLLPIAYVCVCDAQQNTSGYVFPGFRDPPKKIFVSRGQNLTGMDLALERGGTISGTVFDANNAPLENAGLTLMSAPHHSYYDYKPVKTGENGAYTFQGLPTGGTYTVLANHADFASTSKEVVLLDAQGVSGADFHLSPGHMLQGYVRDDAGAPIAKCEVRFDGGRGKRATSDGNGQFTFEHVEPGKYQLSMNNRDENFESPLVFFTMPDANLLDLMITVNRKTPGTISGRVVNTKGEPLSGVRVCASGDTPNGKHVSEDTNTGKDGRFSFTALGDAITCSVDAMPFNYYAPTRQGSIPVGTTDLELVVQRLGTVAGRVVDAATGKPVTEYRVRHVRLEPREVGPDTEYKGEWLPVNAADGRFQFGEVAPPAARVEVSAKGYAPAQSARFEVPEGGSVESVEVKLNAGATIAGRVTDAVTGKPVAGARVRAYAPAQFHAALMSEESSFPGYDTLIDAITDKDGEFTLDTLGPGETAGVVAWHEKYAPQLMPPVTVGEGETPLEITMSAGGTLVVHLANTELAGEPVRMSCRQKDTVTDGEAYKGGDGPEWTGLPSGRYDIIVTTESRSLLGILTAEVAGGATTEVTADLTEFHTLFGSIHGVLRPGANVFVKNVDSEWPVMWIPYPPAECDETGAWQMGGFPPGEYDVKATGVFEQGWHEGDARVTIQAGQDIEVPLTLAPAVHPLYR